jgi:hypothetical protein
MQPRDVLWTRMGRGTIDNTSTHNAAAQNGHQEAAQQHDEIRRIIVGGRGTFDEM